MKYENAKDILPEDLLEKIQKYAAGKLLYIPLGNEKRNWGEASGYREKLQKRNKMICNKYAKGMTISELADEYFLSLDSIKKIIYSRKSEKNLKYEATLKSAVEYSNAGMAEEWIHSFLLFTCNAAIKSEQLMEEEYIYYGVVKLPLRLVQTEVIAEFDSYNPMDLFGEGKADLPPLLIKFELGKFYVMIQKEMFITLKKSKVNAYPSFIIIEGNDNYTLFMKNYEGTLFFVDSV
jgi:hypothetical protein